MNFERVLQIVLVLIVIFAIFLGTPFPKEKMDAAVHEKYPNAREISRLGLWRAETYILCDSGKIILVETSRSTMLPEKRILKETTLPPAEVICTSK